MHLDVEVESKDTHLAFDAREILPTKSSFGFCYDPYQVSSHRRRAGSGHEDKRLAEFDKIKSFSGVGISTAFLQRRLEFSAGPLSNGIHRLVG